MQHIAFARSRLWSGDTAGNTGLVFALCALPLIAAISGAVEFGVMRNERSLMQNAADLGALAGASRLGLASDNPQMVTNAAVAAADKVMAGRSHNAQFTAAVDATGAVVVTGVHQHEPFFGLIDFGESAIQVSATAEGLQKTPLCILQVGDSEMKVDDKAAIHASGCMIHSNRDITVADGAAIRASKTQAVGKVKGSITPYGNNGAMRIADPFAAMDLSPPSPCTSKAEKTIEFGTLMLMPGVHCGKIKASKNAVVHLQPGEHYFMESLEMKEDTRLQGDDVVLIFGADDSIKFAEKATVEITARKSGAFAGFLIITDRENDEKFVIASDNVRELLGTIYIPNAELEVATAGSVAQNSAWSIIVAKTIILKEDPILVINNRYAGSGVPVPEGVGPSAGSPRLTR